MTLFDTFHCSCWNTCGNTCAAAATAAAAVEAVVMRGSAQQYPMMPPAQPHSFPVMIPAGAVPHQSVMRIPPAAVGLPPNMHPQYAFQQSMYGIPVVRCFIHECIMYI